MAKNELKLVLTSRLLGRSDISFWTKIRVFRSAVSSIQTYGSETSNCRFTFYVKIVIYIDAHNGLEWNLERVIFICFCAQLIITKKRTLVLSPFKYLPIKIGIAC